MKTSLAKSALIVCMALSLILSACGASAPAATPTLAASATNTATAAPTVTPTVTFTPTRTPRPTATPNLTATQQYESFIGFVQKAFEAGQISTTDGKYKKLDDFFDELAMSYGFRWTPTGLNAKNFILRAEFDWEVANLKNFSGCGFMFREQNSEGYYLIALDALNGPLLAYPKSGVGLSGPSTWHESLPALKKTKLPNLGSNPYHAAFTLIVNDRAVYIYIDDNFNSEYRLKSDILTKAGALSFMIITGSETDFGTRCKITNAEAWTISP